MGAAKKKGGSPSRSARWDTLISVLRGPAGPVVWVALLVLLLAGGWYLVWRRVGQRALASDRYMLGPQQVIITTPPPDWIHTDIRSEVFRNVSIDGPLSIMDDRLAGRIANAFSLNPWVAEVVRVTKHTPARVEVELVYRRPVCMVEVLGNLLPVDVHGVLLPYTSDDFSPVEKSRYPRLVGVDRPRSGTVGEYWGDARVLGGAEIAAALAGLWEELELQKITPSAEPYIGVADEPTYLLVTRQGTQIVWGVAPGSDNPGEMAAADKIAFLRRYAQQHGTLDAGGGPRRLDVRNMRVSVRPDP